MPSLTIRLTYAAELSSQELYLVLKALRFCANEGANLPVTETADMDALAVKLEEQKNAFQKKLLQDVGKGGG